MKFEKFDQLISILISLLSFRRLKFNSLAQIHWTTICFRYYCLTTLKDPWSATEIRTILLLTKPNLFKSNKICSQNITTFFSADPRVDFINITIYASTTWNQIKKNLEKRPSINRIQESCSSVIYSQHRVFCSFVQFSIKSIVSINFVLSYTNKFDNQYVYDKKYWHMQMKQRHHKVTRFNWMKFFSH